MCIRDRPITERPKEYGFAVLLILTIYCAIVLVIYTILNLSQEIEKGLEEAQQQNEQRIDSMRLEQMELQYQNMMSTLAVSYTHLDVYKRQPALSTTSPRSRCLNPSAASGAPESSSPTGCPPSSSATASSTWKTAKSPKTVPLTSWLR